MPKGLVFVVDDDQSICALVETVLRDEGYAVQAFLRSADVLAALEQERPDAVLFDLWLGETAGSDAYADMSRLWSDATYVLMSAASDAPRIATDLGVGLLAKPFDLDELIALVARAAQPAA